MGAVITTTLRLPLVGLLAGRSPAAVHERVRLASQIRSTIPDLQLVPDTHNDHVLAESGVGEEFRPEGDPPLRVFLDGAGRAKEGAAGIVALLRLCGDGFDDRRGSGEGLGRMQLNARVDAHAQVSAGIERAPVDRRDGDPFPIIELIFDFADEVHRLLALGAWARGPGVWDGMG